MISLKEKPEKGSEGMKEQEKKFQEKEEKTQRHLQKI